MSIRIMLIMTMVSSLVHTNAGAMEKGKNLLPIEQVPVEFFTVDNEHDFQKSFPSGDGINTGIRLYWYRTPTPTYAIASEAVQKMFVATQKINLSILGDDYSADDLKKYITRTETRFNELYPNTDKSDAMNVDSYLSI